MSPLARSWLRRIALGLPLAVTPLAAPVWLGVTACTCNDHAQTFPIDGAQAARILDREGRPTVAGCAAVCDELANGVDAGPIDAAASDGARADAGPPRAMMESGRATGCSLLSEDAQLEVRCTWPSYCPGGRRPTGLDEIAWTTRTAGTWLARMAWMEAASVDAFEELAGALAALGAPSDLVRDARAAADDERDHAERMRALAIARGATPAAPQRTATSYATLEALALDNAVEGGVREAFGAILAAYQAELAPDADVRDAMRIIARDEARHALLSDRIDAWARSRVDGAPLDRARAAAAEALALGLAREHDDAVAAALGFPSLAVQRTIALGLA